jgi:hypothetical protein
MVNMHGEDITQQGARVARIEDGGEGGAFGEAFHQPIVECLREKDSTPTLRWCDTRYEHCP